MWLYKNKEIYTLEDVPSNSFGFIYKTTHIPTNKKYIGKKVLLFKSKSKLRQKDLFLLENTPGRKPKYRIVEKESDWRTYYGSEEFILNRLKKGEHLDFKREILMFVPNKKMLTYYETKFQFLEGVLENEDWLNKNILGKFYKKDFE
tara:strand:+ start:660 stop:1100 length:441 start_codon:yes stop_codon:yes gene_type:complete